MSSAPSGGVAIQFVADMSQVHEALAEIRRGVTAPVNFTPASAGYIGPGGGPTGAPTGVSGPSTFSNPVGGAFNWTSNSSANYIGPGGGSPMTGAGGAQLGQSATQLSTAAAALTQAAQAMGAAAVRGGGAAVGGMATRAYRNLYATTVDELARQDLRPEEEATGGGGNGGARGGGGGRNTFLGMPAGRIARVASWGFVATEAAGMYAADRAYGREYRGAAGNEGERAKLTAQRYTAIQESAFGLGYVVSGVKSYITGEDNNPEGILNTLGDSDAQERYTGLRRSDFATGKQLFASGRIAEASPGLARNVAGIGEKRKEETDNLIAQKSARLSAAESMRQRVIDRANDNYAQDTKNNGSWWQASYNEKYVAGIRDRNIAAANAAYDTTSGAIGREFEPRFSAVNHNAALGVAEARRQYDSSVIASSAQGRAGVQAAYGRTYTAHQTQIEGELAAQQKLNKTEVERQQDLITANYKMRALDIATYRESNFQFGPGGQSDLSSAAIGAHLARDPLRAQHLQNQQARQSALFGLDALPENLFGAPIRRTAQWAVNRNFDQRDQLLDRDHDDRIASEKLPIDADTRRLGILNGRQGTPFSRGIEAQAYQIEARALIEMRSAALEDPTDKSGRGASIKANALAQERRLAQQTFDHFTSAEVDPMRTALNGPATQDTGQAMKNIQDVVASLKGVPTTLDGILAAIQKVIGSGAQ